MIIFAPNTSVSTSSDKTASMTPMVFRYASSASASPGAIRHSNPNACMIPFIPLTNQWSFPPMRRPRFTLGRSGPSNTNRGRKGAASRRAQRKNRVRSSGFSPSRPYAAWKNQMDASIPIRRPRCGGASVNAFVASAESECVSLAGRRT